MDHLHLVLPFTFVFFSTGVIQRIWRFQMKEYFEYKLILKKVHAKSGIAFNINDSQQCYRFLRDVVGIHNCNVEHFVVIAVNAKSNVLGYRISSIGDINSTIVSTRDIFQFALKTNACGILLSHNHPSGNTTPSREDILVTEKIIKGAELFDIEVVDHIIVGFDQYLSFVQEGLI